MLLKQCKIALILCLLSGYLNKAYQRFIVFKGYASAKFILNGIAKVFNRKLNQWASEFYLYTDMLLFQIGCVNRSALVQGDLNTIHNVQQCLPQFALIAS